MEYIKGAILYRALFSYLYEMQNNLKANVLKAVDLKLTEDEYNNFLIDMYVSAKQRPAYSGWIQSNGLILDNSDSMSKAITITIKRW